MPRHWIYYIALIVPLLLRILILDTTFFLHWLWYNGYSEHYIFLSNLSVQPLFVELLGGWPLPTFVCTVVAYWFASEDDDIGQQFVLLPIAYAPFAIIGNTLVKWTFDPAGLYIYPLIVIPAGYVYLLPWILFVWVFTKLRLLL